VALSVWRVQAGLKTEKAAKKARAFPMRKYALKTAN